MKQNYKKFIRIEQILQILKAQSNGASQSDLARRFGVARSTISRDIKEMSIQYPLYEKDNKLYLSVRPQQFILKLTAYEMEALHLFSRLFYKLIQFPFPSATSALRKMAITQELISPTFSKRIRETAEEIDHCEQSQKTENMHLRTIIETIGEALTNNWGVLVSHYSHRSKEVKKYTIAPYTLEPHPEGRSVHLIGWNLENSVPITLKIDRIINIEILKLKTALNEVVEQKIKEHFDSAWSIWATDKSPFKVTLKFSEGVSFRIQETIWHKSQHIELLENGALLWTARIAEPLEMYPWIRGWGPDVEVLEPLALRERHKQDFERGKKLYE